VLADTKTDSSGQPIAKQYDTQEIVNRFAGYSVRILLAEDNITNQQVAIGILKKMGLHADAVANGAEAVKSLETIPYDLVLMDVQMPEMDGFEATRYIRDLQSAVLNHTVPIIAMTAYALRGDRERCLEAGMNDYIAKPVSPQALAEALDKWLPIKTMNANDQISMDSDSVQNSDIPVFDRTGMLNRMMNDEALAKKIIAVFIEDIPRQIKLMKGYLVTGDASSVERQAHTIKGASANVGGEVLRMLAAELENLGKAGDLDAIKVRMPDVEKQFDRLRRVLTNYL
jgi:CheY-like chemotaxis protein/HPt (histidine-containing phosphotransfer) domain-containing protein